MQVKSALLIALLVVVLLLTVAFGFLALLFKPLPLWFAAAALTGVYYWRASVNDPPLGWRLVALALAIGLLFSYQAILVLIMGLEGPVEAMANFALYMVVTLSLLLAGSSILRSLNRSNA